MKVLIVLTESPDDSAGDEDLIDLLKLTTDANFVLFPSVRAASMEKLALKLL